MYKVTKLFADLKDNNHVYNPGDVFPRAGAEASEERIKELSGSDNKRGEPLIELIAENSGDTEKPAEEKPVVVEKPKKSAKKNAEK